MKARHLYLLIIILFIGGVFESFKRISFKKQVNSNNQQITSNELKNLELQPFFLSKGQVLSEAKNFKFKKIKVAGNMKKSEFDFAKTHSFGNAPAKKEDPKKKNNKKSDKKKKENKKDKNKKEDAKPTEVVKYKETENKQKEDPNSSENKIENDIFNGAFGFPQNNNNNKTPASTDEWVRILLDYPSYKKVQEFITHYLGRRVSTAVFYEVLTAMAEDSREDVNIFSVRAAGSTPSYQSFYFLTTVIAEPTMTQKVNSLARNQLETYANLQYLSTLKSIVVTNDYPFAQTLAATLIAKSARTNLKKPNDNTPSDTITPLDVDGNRSPALTASIIKNYEQTKELLTDILKIGKIDNSLISALNEAIRAIDGGIAGGIAPI
ncbi:MAG: hypothetical protein H6625_01555 [Bdellovibrionaceae bacterium]|nr:hypothetical protein [Pseudobdellovibrionaceae bacterium]